MQTRTKKMKYPEPMFHQKLVNRRDENSKVLAKSMDETTKCINSILSEFIILPENESIADEFLEYKKFLNL